MITSEEEDGKEIIVGQSSILSWFSCFLGLGEVGSYTLMAKPAKMCGLGELSFMCQRKSNMKRRVSEIWRNRELQISQGLEFALVELLNLEDAVKAVTTMNAMLFNGEQIYTCGLFKVATYIT
ncbi:hypothetical protein ACHQM5_011082 [Ranunculus cassubicifolius]